MAILTDKWISLEEAATYLDIKPRTLRAWLQKDTDIPDHKVGRQWKFKKTELDEWVISGKSAIE